jgi:hypothetical protein
LACYNCFNFDSYRYIHKKWLGTDGNYRTDKKIKVNDPDDIALTGCRGVFAEDTSFRTYLRRVETEKPIKKEKPVSSFPSLLPHPTPSLSIYISGVHW